MAMWDGIREVGYTDESLKHGQKYGKNMEKNDKTQVGILQMKWGNAPLAAVLNFQLGSLQKNHWVEVSALEFTPFNL